MFMADLLLPGPLAPLAGLACCSAGLAALYAFRKKIPHPAECELIGQCCLLCKCHKHKKFDLVISAHEADNLPKGAKVYLYVECGRFDVQTQDCRSDEKTQKGDLHERLRLHVRQMDEVVKFTIFKRLALSSEEVGSIELNVVKDLIEEDFPSNRWYLMKKDGKNSCKVQMSFTKLEGGGEEEMSPLLMQAMIQAQNEANARGEPVPVINFTNMEPKDRLILLAKALEGPLDMLTGIGVKTWKPFYYKLVETRPDEWQWHWWPDKKSCYDGQRRVGRIRMLGISNVHPSHDDRHTFYVKYHDHNATHEFMFRRVDRDRDVWSDGIYEFLDRFRDYLEKYRQPKTAPEAYLEEKKRKRAAAAAAAASGGSGIHLRRPSFTIDPSVRRVSVAARGRSYAAPSAPRGYASLAADMYEIDETDEEEDQEGDLAAEGVEGGVQEDSGLGQGADGGTGSA